jgi:flavin reductase (DIM6/NTAB) family NADH-FMN oxidoreductase RutF
MPEITPSDLSYREVYKLLIGSVVPRPIAWVSTVSRDGVRNLAPFSFFNAVCSNPPTVLFCTSVRDGDGGQKDTLHNVRDTGVFIINMVTEALAEAMNITATELPPEVDEFERAGLTPAPGRVVNVPYVAESPIHFECRLNQIVPISAEPGGGSIIIGTVVHMRFDETVFREGHYIDIAALKPVGRLSGAGYCRVTDLFDIRRLPSELKP